MVFLRLACAFEETCATCLNKFDLRLLASPFGQYKADIALEFLNYTLLVYNMCFLSCTLSTCWILVLTNTS